MLFYYSVHNKYILCMLQCQNLLESLGLSCAKGKGEAESYCAKLNQDMVNFLHFSLSLQIFTSIIAYRDQTCFLYHQMK